LYCLGYAEGQVAEHHVLKRQGMAAEEWSKEESPPPQQKKMPQPHRCNDRVEDLIQGLYTLDFSGIIRPAWKNARACFKSAEGEEPKMPYLVITDGQQYLERRERKNPPKNFMK